MSTSSKAILTRIIAGILSAFLLLILLMDWAVGILLIFIALTAAAFINLKRPELLDPLRIKIKRKKRFEDEIIEPSISKTFVPSIKLTCRDNAIPIEVIINKAQFLIGRGRNCDYVMDFNNSIGRHHCMINYNHDRREYTICDNDSKSGTKLNGNALEPKIPQPLMINDEIVIDRYHFHVTTV